MMPVKASVGARLTRPGSASPSAAEASVQAGSCRGGGATGKA
jgi:hypothetical protein